MSEEKKVLHAFLVVRNEDGSVDVKDAGLEGVEPIATEAIYKEIEEVSDLIKLKRASDTAFAAAYNGIAKFYQDLGNAQKAQEEPTVVQPPKEGK